MKIKDIQLKYCYNEITLRKLFGFKFFQNGLRHRNYNEPVCINNNGWEWFQHKGKDHNIFHYCIYEVNFPSRYNNNISYYNTTIHKNSHYYKKLQELKLI